MQPAQGLVQQVGRGLMTLVPPNVSFDLRILGMGSSPFSWIAPLFYPANSQPTANERAQDLMMSTRLGYWA